MWRSQKSESIVLTAFQRAHRWISEHTVDGGIIHSAALPKPYPEVTGYFIPSLLKWGEKQRACAYGDWLLSIQTPEGAWQELELKTIYTFDTGQILKGLYALIPFGEKYERSFLKGCDWLLSQIDNEGRIHTPTTSHFSSMGNETIHLYALEPLKLAAHKYNRSDYLAGVNRALPYYLSRSDLTDFNMLTHFHAYIVEALIDLGYPERALEGLNIVKKYQRAHGALPAFPNVRWVCLTALLQYATCYYKLGLLEEGNRLFNYALSKQNVSGGFYGGCGWRVNYFRKTEISWPIKYLLDAIYFKLKLEFSKNDRAESFLSQIDKEDERYRHLISTVNRSAEAMGSIRLLDVGCGKGRFIRSIQDEVGPIEITAMDISDRLFHYLPSGCDKVVGSICSIPQPDNRFDVVFCCETLEHAVNTEAAVKEMARVCKPGGMVVVIDKDLSRKKNIRLEIWEQWFDKDRLYSIMQENNLQVEVKELLTMDGPPIFSWTGKKIAYA